MKKILIASVLTAFGVIHPASAVTLTSFTPNDSGAPAQITFEGFPTPGPQAAFPVLPGVTLAYDNAQVIIQDVNNPNGANPFPSDNSDYLSVEAGGSATFSFTSVHNTFGFQWGSIDSYNTISFYLGGALVGTPEGSFTGSQVVQNPVAANGFQGSNGSAYVVFSGAFDTVVLTSSQNSFEIDNVSVPDGGSTLILLGSAMTGLGLLRRKFNA